MDREETTTLNHTVYVEARYEGSSQEPDRMWTHGCESYENFLSILASVTIDFGSVGTKFLHCMSEAVSECNTSQASL